MPARFAMPTHPWPDICVTSHFRSKLALLMITASRGFSTVSPSNDSGTISSARTPAIKRGSPVFSFGPRILFVHASIVDSSHDRSFRLGSGSLRLGRGFAYRRDKAVSLPGHGLYEPRSLGIVLQGLPDFADRSVDAVVSIEKNVGAPDPFHNLLAGDDAVPLLDQQQKKFRRDALQLEHTTAPAQLVGALVELKILAEPDGFQDSYRTGRHGTPAGRKRNCTPGTPIRVFSVA